MARRFIGTVTIDSINQIGESIKYDTRSAGFVLARRGSPFSMFAHIDPEQGLPDFRELPCVLVSLETDGKLMSINLKEGKAEAIDTSDVIPSNAIFQYVRRKFDGTAVSIGSESLGDERWLRHCNSRLRVCCFDNVFY